MADLEHERKPQAPLVSIISHIMNVTISSVHGRTHWSSLITLTLLLPV